MHDIKFIRENPQAFDNGLKRRGLSPLSSEILALDQEWRQGTTRLQEMQSARNDASKKIGQAKAQKNEAEAQRLMAEVAQIKDEMLAGELRTRDLEGVLNDRLSAIPNLPAADVPDGPDERANKEVRRVGKPREMNFAAKQHFELGEALKLMDFEAAARMSGARFVVLRSQLARLERAIGN